MQRVSTQQDIDHPQTTGLQLNNNRRRGVSGLTEWDGTVYSSCWCSALMLKCLNRLIIIEVNMHHYLYNYQTCLSLIEHVWGLGRIFNILGEFVVGRVELLKHWASLSLGDFAK